MMKRSLIAVILLVVPALANPVAAQTVTVDDLLAHFDAVVFGSEFEGVAAATQVQKWMSPVRVSISDMQGRLIDKPGGGRELKLERVRPDAQKVEIIRRHLTTLVRLTKIENEKSDEDAGKKANFFIKFVPRLAMGAPFLAPDAPPDLVKRLATSGVCYFLTRSIRTGAMFRAIIVVNRELPADEMSACLLEEMTQAMGMPNDSDSIQPSVFNQLSTPQELSGTDQIMLQTLYDLRLPAGTPRRDALRIARTILEERLTN